MKENLLPSRGDTYVFSIGPSITDISILLSYSIIPFYYFLILTDLSIDFFMSVIPFFYFLILGDLSIVISSISPIGLLTLGMDQIINIPNQVVRRLLRNQLVIEYLIVSVLSKSVHVIW